MCYPFISRISNLGIKLGRIPFPEKERNAKIVGTRINCWTGKDSTL
jgi:hypothetical protein